MAQRQKRVTGPLSWSSVRIEIAAVRDSADLASAQGTALLWEKPEGLYLVTNLHNLSGWDHARSKAMSKTGALPTNVRIHLAVANPPRFGRPIVDACLVDDDDNAKWFVHPTHGAQVDVAALFLGSKQEILGLWADTGPETKLLTSAINTLAEFSDFDVDAGDDAYVLGYPLGLDGGEQFPLWKRASVASEPDLDVDKLPKVLIDTATRKGMSGSPVIAVRRGMIPKRGGNIGDMMIGQASSFLGVYSGRVDDDPLGAQIGIVWKAAVIDEIIDAKVIGNRKPWEV